MDHQMWRDCAGNPTWNLSIWACPGFTVSFRFFLSASVQNEIVQTSGPSHHAEQRKEQYMDLFLPPWKGSLGVMEQK